MVPFQDDATIAWDEATKNEFIPTTKKTVTLDLTGTVKSPVLSHDGAISAMTKLSACMIKHQEAELRFKEEKADSRLKSWKKLPGIQQNVLLLGGVEEDGTIPSEPTEEMLSILGCQNGAQVDQYLRQSMQGHNMSLEPGFCTALNKGILASPDDAATPKNFTPFLTPPVGDDDDDEDNANLLKLAVQEKFDEKDLVLLTKMEVTIPMKVPCLRHHVKNYSGAAGRIFGEHSIAHMSLKGIAAHIESKETSYAYEFKQDKLFGGSLLDKIGWRLNRFLDSCAHGDPDKIDIHKLDFSDIMEQVERREYNSKIPSWIKKLVKKQEASKKPSFERDPGYGQEGGGNNGGGGGGGGGGGNGRQKRRQFNNNNDNNRSRRIMNPNVKENCKLKPNEQFRDIFHPRNVRTLTKPKFKTGGEMCLRFHSLGFCFGDCKHITGHSDMDADETADFCQYVTTARSNNSQQRRGNGNRNQDTNPTRTTAGTPPATDANRGNQGQ